MKRHQLIALLGVLTLTAALALPQDYYDEDEERPKKKDALPPAGFWPTQRMMDLFLDRMTEEMSGTYDFDEDQLYNTRELFKERFPTWLNDNRGEIMQLTNEYLEALLAGEAPDSEYVADWAQRTLPLVDEFTDLFEGVSVDMRAYMTEEQQVILDGQMAAFRVGVSYVNQRLGVWSEGGFDAQTEWPGSPEHRQHERQREREMHKEAREAELRAKGEWNEEAETAAAAAADADQPNDRSADRPGDQSRDEWTRYVDNFIRRYQLNQEQKEAAYKYLRYQQEQRDKYLRRSGGKLAEAHEAVKKADSDQQREKTTRQVNLLERPLERMFTQLKEKLDKIPTRAQRQAAAKSEQQSSTSQKATEKAPESRPAGAKRESPSSP
ncbi:MAG: hypothetical protein ABIG44_13255 [Planctomycetota bacterium]